MTRDELLSCAKPILFNAEMERAILDGCKTMARRVLKGYTLENLEIDVDGSIIGVYDKFEGRVRPIWDYAPYCPSSILYVRETWALQQEIYWHKAGLEIDKNGREPHGTIAPKKWRPSIHMPKDAARIFLRVTDVRVERLQDIDDEQAKAEGVNWKNGKSIGYEEKMRRTAVERFAEIWDSTIKKSDLAAYGWRANPWVWVIEFKRIG